MIYTGCLFSNLKWRPLRFTNGRPLNKEALLSPVEFKLGSVFIEIEEILTENQTCLGYFSILTLNPRL